MLRRPIAALFIALIVVVSGCTREPNATGDSSAAAAEAQVVTELGRVAEELARQDGFSGVVLLSQGGRVVFQGAYGQANREKARANTLDTPFALASVSKMFTAVVVAQLAEQNKLRFDDSIGTLLPMYPPGQSKTEVNVRHLLTMSSGIPDIFRMPKFWTEISRIRVLSDFWPLFATTPLEFPPGSKWAYSNSNFVILGAIIERLTGGSFLDEVERRIFKPVGMAHTSYHSTRFPDAAMGYTRTPPDSERGKTSDSKRWYRAWEDPADNEARGAQGSTDFIAGSPLGGGISTAADLARFADALMAGKLLSRELTDKVLTGIVPADYGGLDGYGFETREVNGVRIAGHRGGFSGVTNEVEFYPDLGYVLVVLGNTDPSATQEIATRLRTLISESPVLSKRR